MKKTIISLSLLLMMTSSAVEEKVYIYCKPDINICIHNLKQLKYWIELDKESGKIDNNMYTEYHIAVNATILSLEMILDNQGQCDTTDNKVYKLKYE
tara:strand:+ start:392 stop:682 length:291 start_codon:yes stop_codon:yes gene_type:complete